MGRRLLLGWFLAAIGALAADAGDAGPYNTLRVAPRFAVGGVGYAGATSHEEIALHVLLERPEPSADLRRLLSEATVAGQLYALWGLAVVRDLDFERLSAEYTSMQTEVETMNGCIVEREKVSSIAKRIRDGAYRKPAN